MATDADKYEQLTAYLDGELSEREEQQVERLLERDPEARRLLENLRHTSRLLAALPRAPAPANLAEAVSTHLERQALLGERPLRARKRIWWHGAARLTAVGAGLALMCASVWLSWRRFAPITAKPATITVADNEQVSPPAGLPEPEGGPMSIARGAQPKSRESSPPRSDAEDTSKRRMATRSLEPVAAATPPARQSERALSDRAFPRSERESGRGAVLGPESPPAEPGRSGLGEFARAAGPAPSMSKAAPTLGPPPVEQGIEGRIDRLLLAKVLTNADLHEASPESFENQLVAETDPTTAARLVGVVEEFMHSNEVPDAERKRLPEPISPQQAFYAIQQRQPTQIVMNVQPSQAAELLRVMERTARANQTEIAWTANSVPVAGDDPPREVMRQFASRATSDLRLRRTGGLVGDHDDDKRAADQGPAVRTKMQRPAAAESAEAAHTKDATRAAAGAALEPATTTRSRLRGPAQKADTVPPTGPMPGLGELPGSTSTPFADEQMLAHPDGERLIQIAISLRGRPAPTTSRQAAEVKERTTSQSSGPPSTQRAAGG